MVLVLAVMGLLPHAVDASKSPGVTLSKAAADSNAVSAQRLSLAPTDTLSPTSTLVWSDEFDGPAGATPDSDKWQTVTGLRCLLNHELEFYTARASNVATDGAGHLAIVARSETYGSGAQTRAYTSGMVETSGLYSTMYGSIQASIKLPFGRGLWPAFWALPDDPTAIGPLHDEIDVMESLGHDPHRAYGTIHGTTASGTPKAYALGASAQSPASLASAFHVYGVDWYPGCIQFTLDGTVYATFTPNSLSADQQWVFDQPFYLILNLAVGGDWPGAPDETTPFPATMLVDWVRVFSAPSSPIETDTVGPTFAVKNATVVRGRTCKIYFAASDTQSPRVTARVAIVTKSGVVKAQWSRRCSTSSSCWLWRKYTCRLRPGTYRILVAGRDLTGNRASVVGRARLVVKKPA